jgi:hypothetical protein
MKLNQNFTNHELSFLDECKKIMMNDGDDNDNNDDDDDILDYYYKNE